MRYFTTFTRISFTGRINRLHFLCFSLLIPCLISFILSEFFYYTELINSPLRLTYFLFFIWLLILIPSLIVRRLHDLDLSGAWLLIFFTPLLFFLFASPRLLASDYFDFLLVCCAALLLFLYLVKGTTGVNRYGEDPQEYSDYLAYLDDLSCREKNHISDPSRDETPDSKKDQAKYN